MSEKLFLLDAYALIYRAYYAFIKNPRINSKGLNTSAIFGFTNTLLEIIDKEKPSHLAVVFDPPGPTFRHEMYKEYKAHREETPEDIRKSVPIIKEVIEGFNIPIIEVMGYEADDVIGTVALKASEHFKEVYMMTPDKDYGQLIRDNVFMFKPSRMGNGNEVIDKEKLCEKYKIDNPLQIIDILALMGDSSDNIPGAPGIGEKTAQKLIGTYGSIDKIYENIEDLKGKQKENLVNFKDQVMLSRTLVTIKIDVPYDFSAEKLEKKDPSEEKLMKLFNDLEFRNMAQRVFQKEVAAQPTAVGGGVQGSLFGDTELVVSNLKKLEDIDHEYILVDDQEKRTKLIQDMASLKEFCFDTETTSLNIIETELVGLAISWEKSKAFYVPFPEDRDEAQTIINEFKDVFSNDKIIKIGQNIKYDIQVLKNYGITVKGEIFDTMIAHYLIQPETKHNLNFLAEHYLQYKPVEIEELIGKKGKNQQSMRSVPIEKIKEYAGEDADLTYQLKLILEKELDKAYLSELATMIEFPLIPVLADMEYAGVNLCTENLNRYSKLLTEELIKVEKQIHDHAGVEFNISSPKQLGEILFDRLKIDPNAKKTKTKQYSTSEETLQKVADKHPIVNDVLEFRSLKKLISTYVDALPLLINSKTGKIHSSYNQAVTATGRLSSNNPNLQNIPIREERGKEIRKSFIPSDEEHLLLAADYSQIELRLMAHMSQDTNMVQAFKAGADVHTSTAANIFHVENIDEVTSDQRRQAKTANFGIIYGISAFGLSQRLNISRSEAKELIDQYFVSFPKVKEYMDKSIDQARNRGYVETMLGRKRYLPDINSRNATVRGFAERNAINAPLQGSAADIIKIAMIDIHRELIDSNYKSKMIMQVHDELVFDVHKPELEKLTEMIKDKMENAIKLSIPLTVDVGVGQNWLEAH